MRRLSRLIAFVLLAWLPLQAAALPGLVALCELDPAHAPAHQSEHDAAAHGHGDHARGDEGGAGGHDGSVGGPGCCHHPSTSAVPPLVIRAPDIAHVKAVATPSHPHEFFPEQPKRPPLGAA